jgi:hypothetical protein
MVRVVLDNVNSDLLRSLNGRLAAMPPFEPYANRNDVVKFTSKIVAVMSDPPRWVFWSVGSVRVGC